MAAKMRVLTDADVIRIFVKCMRSPVSVYAHNTKGARLSGGAHT